MNIHSPEEKCAAPISLQEYLDIDLRPDADIARDLLRRAELEAPLVDEGIELSELVGPHPANVTPEMAGWYQLYVEAVRSKALHAIVLLFKQHNDPAKGEGFLAQTRLGSLEEDLLKKKFQVYQSHAQNNVATTDRIRELEKRIAENGHKYDVRKAQLGRDAKLPNSWLYFLVLLFVLFGSESALNLEAFEALPWATPAIAWGATVVIGIAIGLAAHYHGTVFKQWGYYFGAEQDDTRRGPAWRMLIQGTTALIVSLCFVYYARSAYFASYVVSVGSFGQQSASGGFLWVVGGSLLGNFLVYLTGVLWAYLMHDSDPDFVDLRRDLDRDRKVSGALKQKLEAAQHREIEQLTARYKRKVEEAERASGQIMEQAALSGPSQLFKNLQAKDAQVIALLHNYRQVLIQKMGPDAKKARFVACRDDPHCPTEVLTASQFKARAIRLKYLEA
ncbi:MAG: hypothetical protein JO056_01640 [Alphaproteobacteria bacterium]|jgi:hypothetical protein|nr:hypothetical protein [Alphaproteobacteria bacterium]